jgi:hypothetical protein
MRNKYIPLSCSTNILVQSFFALTVNLLRSFSSIFSALFITVSEQLVQTLFKNSKTIISNDLSFLYTLKPNNSASFTKLQSLSIIHDNRRTRVIRYPYFENFHNSVL